MNHSADETRASLANNLRYFIKWSLIALLIGGTGGLIGSLFSMGVSFATSFRMNHPNMLFFLPVSGILIVWLYHTFMKRATEAPTWSLMPFLPRKSNTGYRTADLCLYGA